MNVPDLLHQIKGLDSTVKSALIAASIALLIGLFNLIIGIFNFVNQKKSLKIQSNTYQLQVDKQKSNIIKQEDDLINFNINKLQKQLEEFFIPFNSYLSQSYILYLNMRAGLPEDFRALIYLIDNNYLFGDKDGSKKKASLGKPQLEILDQIFNIEDKLRNIIVEKAGLISDSSLLMAYTPDNSSTDVFLNFDPNKPENMPKETGLLDLFIVHCILIKWLKVVFLIQIKLMYMKDLFIHEN